MSLSSIGQAGLSRLKVLQQVSIRGIDRVGTMIT
jgi:hypothetical protein